MEEYMDLTQLLTYAEIGIRNVVDRNYRMITMETLMYPDYKEDRLRTLEVINKKHEENLKLLHKMQSLLENNESYENIFQLLKK